MARKLPPSLPIRFAGGLLMAAGAFIYVGNLSGLPFHALHGFSGTLLMGGAMVYAVGEVIRTWD